MIKRGAFGDTVRAEGLRAIEIAGEEGLTLCKYTDPTELARTGLSVEEAQRVALEDPTLIYVAWSAACVAPELDGSECGDSAVVERSVDNGGAPLCAYHAAEWRHGYGHTTVTA